MPRIAGENYSYLPRLKVDKLVGPFATQQAQSVILFGDSYAAAQNLPPLGDTTSLSLYRFLLPKLGNAVKVARNAGVSGNTTQQMLSRIAVDVLPFQSDWVFVNGGVNDFYGNSRTADEAFSDMTKIVNILIADGRKVLLFNCPPQLSTRSSFTSAKSTENAKYNKMIKSYSEGRSGLILVDIYSPLVDWADTANAAALPQFLAGDGIHLSTLGGLVCAEVAIQKLSTHFSPDLSILNSPLDSGIAGSEGLFLGTGGSNGASSSGSVATSYTSVRASGTNGAIVCSKLPLRGQRQTVTLTAANGEMRTRISGNLLTELTPFIGKSVSASILMRLRTTSGGVCLKDLIVKLFTQSGSLYQAINGTTTAGFPAIIDTTFDTGLVLIELRDLFIEPGLSSAGMFFELLLDSVAGGVVEFDMISVDIREA